MAKRYNPHYETLYLTRKIHLCVWADCNASGALVYAYLRDWIEYNKTHIQTARHRGRFWVYRTIDEIYDGIGRVISKRAITMALKSLVEHHYLIIGDFNKVRSNRTNYYALDRDPDERLEDGSSPESLAVLDLKAKMDAKKEARKSIPFDIEAFTEELMYDRDYTDTEAEHTFVDEYGREFCFVELSEAEQEVVIHNYVESTLRQGSEPNFNNFVSMGVQQTLANRFAALV